MAAELCPFDWHIIWANKCILESSTERAIERPASETRQPLYDGHYIDPIAL